MNWSLPKNRKKKMNWSTQKKGKEKSEGMKDKEKEGYTHLTKCIKLPHPSHLAIWHHWPNS